MIHILRQILIGGDSTVTNGTYTEESRSDITYTGWGKMLPLYLGPYYTVKNFAKSGLTTDTFVNEGHYNALINNLNSGDYVLLQFGHNDQKRLNLKANERFKNNLINFIEDIISKNGIPILVTPLARNSWNGSDNKYNDLIKKYTDNIVLISKEMNVPLIDLNKKSKKWIINEGREKVKPYFYPGDFTHTNDYGAYKMAGFIYNDLKNYIEPIDNDLIWTDFCPSKIPLYLYDEKENLENFLTFFDAYKIVRELCSFFASNSDRLSEIDFEIACAKENHYFIFENNLNQFITKEEFIILLKAAVSSREIINSALFTNEIELNKFITKREVLRYLEELEETINYKPEIKIDFIKGS